MVGYLLAGIFLAGLLLLLLKWWADADVKSAQTSLMWMIIGVCLVLALVLLATGKALLAIVPAGYAALRMVGPMIAKQLLGRVDFGRFGSGTSGRAKESSSETMSKQEALEVLGLNEPVSDQDVNEAYRRLMAQMHPDKGGSDWMAAKLNAARRTLLD